VEPGLYLVATPIGNLRDMTLRALDVLAAADLVLAEDTRVTAKLLTAYGLKARLERCDDHASGRAAEQAIKRLRNGEVVALVSDAGTPLVSDPGFVVARAVIAEGLPVHPIPGPSSLLAALCIAGLPADRVLFVGFLPSKAGARATGETRGVVGEAITREGVEGGLDVCEGRLARAAQKRIGGGETVGVNVGEGRRVGDEVALRRAVAGTHKRRDDRGRVVEARGAAFPCGFHAAEEGHRVGEDVGLLELSARGVERDTPAGCEAAGDFDLRAATREVG
jgi:hypothetical protein